jgi:hypothetical protein
MGSKGASVIRTAVRAATIPAMSYEPGERLRLIPQVTDAPGEMAVVIATKLSSMRR